MENNNCPQANSRQKGYDGEDKAAEHLLAQGYNIISRNYQSRKGEIDCIAEDPCGTLVFIEVKSANSSRFGNPAFWVTRGKQLKIAQMAKRYLAEHGYTSRACRFDVITIFNGKIDHIKNAFLA